MDGRQNFTDYCATLWNNFFDFAALCYDRNRKLQQGNASVHTSQVANAWFNDSYIEMTKWPACSLDLNSIENLWGVFARGVHHSRSQCSKNASLKTAIEYKGTKLVSFLQNLVSSLRKQCVEVLRFEEGEINF